MKFKLKEKKNCSACFYSYTSLLRFCMVSLILFSVVFDLCDARRLKAKSHGHGISNRHRSKGKSNRIRFSNSRVATSYPLQSLYAQDELPKIRMFIRVNSGGNKGSVGRERRLVFSAENAVLIVGEDIPKGGNIVLECSASYPVEWVYHGEGFPSYEVNTSALEPPISSSSASAEHIPIQNSGSSPGEDIRNADPDGFLAYSFASLGGGGNLSEHNTGNYTCQHLLHKEIASFVYIYVPGPKLFVATKQVGVTRLSPQKKPANAMSMPNVRIPCTVSNPKVVVHLQKSVNGVMMPCSLPMNNSIRFDPATGFYLRYIKECDIAGTYICTASYNDTFEIYKHTVYPSKDCIPMIEPAMSFHENKEKHKNMSQIMPMKYKHPCKTFTCGLNALCQEINKEPICLCFDNFTGDPYKECRHVHSAFFFQTDDPCNPEIKNEICGKNSECKNVDGLAVCSCHKDYTGHPPGCHSKSCKNNDDCPVDQFCYDKKCEDPCPGACGQNSICSVSNHVPSCVCKKGYDGDPFTVCCMPDETGEYPCRPKYCTRNENCSDVQKCKKGRCKDVCYGAVCGGHAICGVEKKTRQSVCSCEAGFTGDPYSSSCVELSPERQKTDSLESTLWYSSDEKGSSAETGFEKMCSSKKNFCAKDADCRVIGQIPICKCKVGYHGDPYRHCTEEKILDVSDEEMDDPKNRDLGIANQTNSDPCKEFPFPCGEGAECTSEKLMTICNCPVDTVGDPFESCKPVVPTPMIQIIPVGFPFRIPIAASSLIKATQGYHHSGSSGGGTHTTNHGNTNKKSSLSRNNACNPSPCGPFSKCVLFNALPLCSCLPGYSWIMSTCQPTPPTTESYLTCLKNSDCAPSEVCRNNQCGITQYREKASNGVCNPSPCGPHSSCRVQEETHRAICQCKYPKYGGSPPRCNAECIVDDDCQSTKENELICNTHGVCQPGSRYK